MKKKTKVLFTLVFAITLIFALLVPTFAAYDDDGYVIWEVKENGDVLVGEKEYYRIEIPVGYEVYMREEYHYANKAASGKIELSDLTSNINGKNIVHAYDREGLGYSGYFADSETCDYLSDFLVLSRAKDMADMILFYSNGDYYKDVDNEILQRLDSMSTSSVNIKVSALYDYNRTYIYAYDKTGCIRTTTGCVYAIGDTRYYVDYTTLSNSYFDVDGDFSYRGNSTVEAKLLDNVTNTAFQSFKNSENEYYFPYDTQYEKNAFDMIFTDVDETVIVIFGIVIFYSILILVGLVLPVIPIVFGLVLPRSKKLGKHPGWYALAGVGAIWLISAVVLIIYITVCFLIAVL